jgi:copper homeostasis protein (lipoprotein)
MNKTLTALACLASLVAAGCQQQPAEPAADAASMEAAPAPVATGITPTAESSGSDQGPGFDMKGFAGTFTGTMPCANCPGIDTTLELAADGTYRITEVYQEEDVAPREMDGTWTVEADDRQIRLDPNSKEEQDRLFEITSEQQITQLDLEGRPIASGLDHSLTRQSAG